MTSQAAMAGRPAEPRSVRSLVTCATIMEAGLLLLYADVDRSATAYLTLVGAAYLIAGGAFLWLLRTLRFGPMSSPAAALAVVIAGAAVLRLTLFPLPPGTSNDACRYLWEGFAQTRGFNPYVHAPAAPQLSELARERPELLAAVNHPTIPSIYPPFAQLLFRSNELLTGGSVLGWKLVLLGFDTLLGISAALILRRRGIDLAYLCMILWNPLLLIESYEGAHLDLIGISLLVVAIAAAQRQRWVVSAVAMALCIQVKYLWPMLGLILLAYEARRQRRWLLFIVTAGVVSLACWAPYTSGFWPAARTARAFIEYWRFNGPLFEMLHVISGPTWMPMALVLTVLTMLALLMFRRGNPDLLRDSTLLSATALLLGPVAYPWYFVWIVPWLLVERALWVALWPTLVALLHLWVGWNYRQSGTWQTPGPLAFLIAVLPLIGMTWTWWMRLRNRFGSTGFPARRESQPQIVLAVES